MMIRYFKFIRLNNAICSWVWKLCKTQSFSMAKCIKRWMNAMIQNKAKISFIIKIFKPSTYGKCLTSSRFLSAFLMTFNYFCFFQRRKVFSLMSFWSAKIKKEKVGDAKGGGKICKETLKVDEWRNKMNYDKIFMFFWSFFNWFSNKLKFSLIWKVLIFLIFIK